MQVFRGLWRYPEITAAVVLLAAVLLLHTVGEGSAARWVATAYVGTFIVWTLVGMVRDVVVSAAVSRRQNPAVPGWSRARQGSQSVSLRAAAVLSCPGPATAGCTRSRRCRPGRTGGLAPVVPTRPLPASHSTCRGP